MAQLKRDHTTFERKVALRRVLRARMGKTAPVIIETHGGTGRLFAAVFPDIGSGAVFERDPRKADFLARQRPSWSVYEGDCAVALLGGAAAHLQANVIDLDPWGEPWPALRGFFRSERPRPRRVWVVVNDGLRQKVRMGGSWNVASLAPAVARFGNDLHARYLEVCRWLVEREAAQAGYHLRRWVGYYCGHAEQMTHYLAELERSAR